MLVTVKELEELPALVHLIQHEKDRLRRLRDAAGIKSPSLSGMPSGTGPHDRIAENIPAAVDLESEITDHLNELEERRRRIEVWIVKQPVRIQLIVRLKYLEGMTWDEVASEVCKDSWKQISEDAVRMYLKRHLRAEEQRNERDGHDQSGG